jgi:hypothetical protein
MSKGLTMSGFFWRARFAARRNTPALSSSFFSGLPKVAP